MLILCITSSAFCLGTGSIFSQSENERAWSTEAICHEWDYLEDLKPAHEYELEFDRNDPKFSMMMRLNHRLKLAKKEVFGKEYNSLPRPKKCAANRLKAVHWQQKVRVYC